MLSNKRIPRPRQMLAEAADHAGSDMAREIARSWEGRTSRRLRKKIEVLFAQGLGHGVLLVFGAPS